MNARIVRDAAESSSLVDADLERFASSNDGIDICYRVDGPGGGIPLVLVIGLGLDLTAWPASLVQGLIDAGHRVVRLDNRDAGRSTRVASPPPAAWRLLLGRPRSDTYLLSDMAADVVGLMDHLDIESAHVVGMSMGGMIAQTIAAQWPERVRSLTSMISTTGHPKVGRPTPATMFRLVMPSARTREKFIEGHLAMTRHLAGPAFRPDDAAEARYAGHAWDRADSMGDPLGIGTARQIQAILASGDRTSQLIGIIAPTLVIHGDHDLIVAPSGGVATAHAVADARLEVIEGMGHHFAPGVVDRLVELIVDHTRKAVPA